MSYLSLAHLGPHQPTLVSALLASVGRDARTQLSQLALVLVGTVLLAASARLVVVLPFSPVPITGQTFAVLVIGMAFGARLGAATVIAYLAQGAMGLPVFAAGNAGIAYLMGPTGGFLFGFIIAAWLTGKLATQGFDRSPLTTAIAMLAGNLAIYIPGLLWLGLLLGWPLGKTLAIGMTPYLSGDLAKLVLAAAIMPAAWWLLGRRV